MKLALPGLLGILACGAHAETDLAIVVAIPESFQITDWYIDDDDCDNCLIHGNEIIVVDLNVTNVLLGSIAKRPLKVAATDGFLRHRNRRSGDNRHLFVLRRLSGDFSLRYKIRYEVAEADPFGAEADPFVRCTVFPIEDYLSDDLWISYDVPVADAENCYTVNEITRLVNRRPG